MYFRKKYDHILNHTLNLLEILEKNIYFLYIKK